MPEANANARLETFCDGVFAIALTLLIIDIKLPATDTIATNADFWRALSHLTPSILAFVLSFGIILITWVNHHAVLKLVGDSSASFIYGNGFLLLTVVVLPFPTSLLGEFVLTDHAAPAVVLYDAILAVQAVGWILISGSALSNQLVRNESATALMRINHRNGYVACALYGLLAVAAFWLPVTIAIITTGTWIYWLIHGIRMKHV